LQNSHQSDRPSSEQQAAGMDPGSSMVPAEFWGAKIAPKKTLSVGRALQPEDDTLDTFHLSQVQQYSMHLRDHSALPRRKVIALDRSQARTSLRVPVCQSAIWYDGLRPRQMLPGRSMHRRTHQWGIPCFTRCMSQLITSQVALGPDAAPGRHVVWVEYEGVKSVIGSLTLGGIEQFQIDFPVSDRMNGRRCALALLSLHCKDGSASCRCPVS